MTVKWATFTKRTNDPKLTWIEEQLDALKIQHRRKGESYHAPILEVPEDKLDDALAFLDPIDDIPDDDKKFQRRT